MPGLRILAVAVRSAAVLLCIAIGLACRESSPATRDDLLAHSDTGRGERAVLLIHCWSCDRHIWDGQIGALAVARRVVAVDLAGHGESSALEPAEGWTIPGLGQGVAALVSRLGLRRVVLVGSSMGAAVALDVAEAAMPNANRGGWKTCSRGHKYRGSRCPICWRRAHVAKQPGKRTRPARRAASA